MWLAGCLPEGISHFFENGVPSLLCGFLSQCVNDVTSVVALTETIGHWKIRRTEASSM